jgi:hypothetical protein
MVQDDQFDLLITGIKESIERIPGHLIENAGLFAHFNAYGTLQPIFWCFNDWAEAVLLADWLGPDQPLYAMRSSYGFIKGSSAKRIHTTNLAEAYADEIIRIVGDQPIVIGGNCQSAPIAEAISHNLISRSRSLPLVITLEHQPFYCYPGPILMLFGSRSVKFNPFLSAGDPVPAWRRQHAAPAWGVVDGEHGKYFLKPAIDDLGGHIASAARAFFASGDFCTGEIDLKRRPDSGPCSEPALADRS